VDDTNLRRRSRTLTLLSYETAHAYLNDKVPTEKIGDRIKYMLSIMDPEPTNPNEPDLCDELEPMTPGSCRNLPPEHRLIMRISDNKKSNLLEYFPSKSAPTLNYQV